MKTTTTLIKYSYHFKKHSLNDANRLDALQISKIWNIRKNNKLIKKDGRPFYKKDDKLYFVDFETKVDKQKDENNNINGTASSEVILAGCYSSNYDYFYTHNIGDLFIELAQKNINMTVDIFIHFLFFDSYFIINFLLANKYKQSLKQFLGYKDFKLIKDDGHNVYYLLFHFANTKFVFHCSYKLLITSVAKLGEIIDLPKPTELDITGLNRDNRDDREVLDRCFKDTYIIAMSVIKFLNKFNKSQRKKVLPLTIASATEKILKRDFYNKAMHKMYKIKNIYEWEYYNNYYFGGLTGCNNNLIKQELKNVYQYDITSAYPEAMSEEVPIRIVNKIPKDSKYIYKKMLEIEIKRCNIKQPYYPACFTYSKANILNKKDKDISRWCKRCHDVIAYYWEDEFNILKEIYEIEYKILKETIWLCLPIYTEFITNYFNLKLVSKEKNLDYETYFYKIVLNSSYGKLGQRPIRLESFITDEELKIYDNIYLASKWHSKLNKNYFIYRKQNNQIGNNNIYLIEECKYKTNKSFSPVYQASYITSKVRIKLLKSIIKQSKNFVYCDTDSMKLLEPIKDIPIGRNLGDWAIEDKAIRFFMWGQKKYIYEYTKNNETLLKITISGYNPMPLDKNFDLLKLGGEFINYGGKLSWTNFGLVSNITTFTL